MLPRNAASQVISEVWANLKVLDIKCPNVVELMAVGAVDNTALGELRAAKDAQLPAVLHHRPDELERLMCPASTGVAKLDGFIPSLVMVLPYYEEGSLRGVLEKDISVSNP